jgi:NAD(P)H-nitrite reductase large subunit
MTNDPIICDCNDIHKSTIESAIKERGLKMAAQINKEFYMDRACGVCLGEVQKILDESRGN